MKRFIFEFVSTDSKDFESQNCIIYSSNLNQAIQDFIRNFNTKLNLVEKNELAGNTLIFFDNPSDGLEVVYSISDC